MRSKPGSSLLAYPSSRRRYAPDVSNEHNLRGAAWMTLGMLGYVVNDAFV